MNDRQMLDEMGIDYDTIDAELALISDNDITAAQSRIDGLDPDQVRIYAECMKNGDVFPEIVVAYNKNNRFFVLSGNHRVKAARLAGRETLPALQVYELTDAQKRMIVAGANNKHGKAVTIDDRRLQACGMVEAFGWTHAEAAKAYGLSESQVQTAMTTRKSNARFDRLAGERLITCKKPSQDTLRTLQRLRSDRAFAVAVDAAQYVPTEELETGVVQANRKNNEEDAVAIFEKILDKGRARVAAMGGRKAEQPGPLHMSKKLERQLVKLTGELVRSQPKDEESETRLILHRIQMHIEKVLDERG